jgi:hypothetical protein
MTLEAAKQSHEPSAACRSGSALSPGRKLTMEEWRRLCDIADAAAAFRQGNDPAPAIAMETA